MPPITARRAIWISALVACGVYLGAVANQWALDDHPVIGGNPAAHSIRLALEAAFHLYWPPSAQVEAGLYRPLTILTYAIDWTISGGSPGWLHFVNVLLHGLATALAVVILLAWLPPRGALAAGLVFAVHPVHVEAVANVVGRAELLATIFLFVVIISARRYRQGKNPRRWFALTMAATAGALLSKESGVVAFGLVALDEWLETGRLPRLLDDLYIAGATLTLGWLFLWHAIAGSYVATTMAANFYELTSAQRIWTMLPAEFDLLRLLTFPLDLSVEYSPQVIPQALALTPLGVCGAVVAGALIGVGLAHARRVPVVAFGILAAAISYAPTSNLLFPSGVALAERILYLAALAPAAVVGVLVTRYPAGRERLVLSAVALLLVSYVARTVTRIPFWHDSRTVIIDDLLQHPENFRAHDRVAHIFLARGDTSHAIAEYLAAESIFPLDPFLYPYTVPVVLARRHLGLARAQARYADSLRPDNPAIVRLAVDVELAVGRPESTVVIAARAADQIPDSPLLASLYVTALRAAHVPRWRELIALARVGSLEGRFVATGPLLDSVAAAAPTAAADPSFCAEVRRTFTYVALLRPRLAPILIAEANAGRRHCVLPPP